MAKGNYITQLKALVHDTKKRGLEVHIGINIATDTGTETINVLEFDKKTGGSANSKGAVLQIFSEFFYVERKFQKNKRTHYEFSTMKYASTEKISDCSYGHSICGQAFEQKINTYLQALKNEETIGGKFVNALTKLSA